MTEQPISFGDNVRVLNTVETENAGVAGFTGQVFGYTTPSVTGVDVIGGNSGDFAINVYFEEQKISLWFTPELLEFIDFGVGTEITLKGIDKKWTRTSTGEWSESPGSKQHHSLWERITNLIFQRKG